MNSAQRLISYEWFKAVFQVCLPSTHAESKPSKSNSSCEEAGTLQHAAVITLWRANSLIFPLDWKIHSAILWTLRTVPSAQIVTLLFIAAVLATGTVYRFRMAMIGLLAVLAVLWIEACQTFYYCMPYVSSPCKLALACCLVWGFCCCILSANVTSPIQQFLRT